MAKKRQPTLVVAAAVAEVAKELGDVYVFATIDKTLQKQENAHEIIAKEQFSKCVCSDCNTTFAAVSDIEPFCVTCGSENVKRGEVANLSVHNEKDLAAITCREKTCGSVNILHQNVITAAKGQLHCVACGTPYNPHNLTVVADDSLPEDDEVTVDDLEEIDVDALAADEGPGDAPGAGAADRGAGDVSGRDGVSPGKDAPDAGAEDRQDAPANKDAGGNKSQDPDKTAIAPDTAPDAQSERPVQEGEVCEEGQDDTLDEDVEEVEMMDMVDDDAVEDMAVLSMQGNLHIACGPYIIARLTEEASGDNKDIFSTEEFRRAIANSLKADGVKKTVEAFGFKPITVKAKISKVVAKKVDEIIAKEQKTLADRTKALIANFKQSLDIAAVGLNRSFWKDKINPLKASLVKELAALGIRKPETVVNNLFKDQGVAYNAVLIEQAEALLTKTPEARAELSSVLDMTGVLASDEEDDDDTEDDVSDDFAMSAVRETKETATHTRKTTTASGQRSRVRELAGGQPLFLG